MLLCVLFGIFGAEPYMRSLTPQPETIAYGVDYIRVICIASFGIFGELLFERLLQATGRTSYTMITQGTGAIINIILDPILIFGYFGLPRMEVTGAACPEWASPARLWRRSSARSWPLSLPFC